MNKAIICGNAGDLPSLFFKEDGDFQWAYFNIATKDRDKTFWHKIKTNNRAAQFISKGSKVLVEGLVRYDEFEKDGQKRKDHYIYATSINVLTKFNEDFKNQDNTKDEIDDIGF